MEGIYKSTSDYNLQKGQIDDDGSSSVATDLSSDQWYEEDIISSTPAPNFQELKSRDISCSILYAKEPDESKLIEEEIDLYQDLLKKETEEKMAKEKEKAELENLRKENQTLKKADAISKKKIEELTKESKKKIEELTKETTSLRKSICSLYKTAKDEIARKDGLLAKTNKDLDYFKLECLKYRDEATRNGSFEAPVENRLCKRRRSRSPELPCKQKEPGPRTNSENDLPFQSKISCRSVPNPKDRTGNESQKSTSENDCLVDKNVNCTPRDFSDSRNRLSNDSQRSGSHCIPQSNSPSDNSSFLSETNEKFSLLPEALKNSFYEYERSQLASLNALKQSFIDNYFEFSGSVQPSVANGLQNRQMTQGNYLIFGNQSQHTPSVSTTSAITTFEDQSGRTLNEKVYRHGLLETPQSINQSQRVPSVSTDSANFSFADKNDRTYNENFQMGGLHGTLQYNRWRREEYYPQTRPLRGHYHINRRPSTTVFTQRKKASLSGKKDSEFPESEKKPYS